MTCRLLAGQHIKRGENALEIHGVLGIGETPNPSLKWKSKRLRPFASA